MFFSDLVKSVKPGDRVLEIGPGGTPHSRADMFLDLDPKLFKNEEEAEYQRGQAPALKTDKPIVYYDGKKFPFKDNEFDYVICSHVLEHVESVPEFLQELFRITTKGYIEYPTILYDYMYDIPVHPNFLYFNQKTKTLNWLKKDDTSFSDFKEVQGFFRESVIQGHDCLIQSLEKSMIQGFEWSKPFTIKKSRSIKALVPPIKTIGEPKFKKPPTVLTVPDVIYKPLEAYTAKELALELRRRTERKVTKALPIRNSVSTLDTDIQRVTDNLHKEMDFFSNMKPLGRQNIYNVEELSVEERFLEKVWWWMSDKQHDPNKSWVHQWIQEHPAGSVGTHNLTNREEWLERTLKKIPKDKRILDAGAGELQYKRFCDHLDYVSQDFGQYTGEGNTSGLQTGTWDNSKLDIVSDILDIPVPDKSFDAIMCIEVFEHIPKPVEALKEFSRIIKKGGKLVITAPFACLTHFAPYFYYNGFSQYFYKDLLEELGFEILDLTFNGNYFEYLAQEVRRFEGVGERYAPDAKKPNAVDTLSQHVLLRRLEELSAKDTGSSELLVHGINILAVKK